MKKFSKLFFVLSMVIPMFFVSCQKNEVEEPVQTPVEYEDYGYFKDAFDYCGDPITYDLLSSDFSMNGGTVEIGNDDEDMLHITITAAPGHGVVTSHVYVGAFDAIPGVDIGAGTGNFYMDDPLFETHTHPSPYAEEDYFSADLAGEGDMVAVIVHTLMRFPDGMVYNLFARVPLKMSGFYIEYTKQTCDPNPTFYGAFAYSDQYARCFKDFRKRNGKYRPNGNRNFKRWGWTNGKLYPGNYTLELWADVGDCDPTQGILVGHVDVDYNGCQAVLTYNMLPGYVLLKTQAYVGKRWIPKKHGKFTVAPRKYPKKHRNLGGVTTDTFTFNNLWGKIKVIAHARVGVE